MLPPKLHEKDNWKISVDILKTFVQKETKTKCQHFYVWTLQEVLKEPKLKEMFNLLPVAYYGPHRN